MSNLLNIKDQNGNWIPIPVVTNGIKSITQNEDYTLTITLNDGTTYTTTSIKGEDGQDYILTEQDKQDIAGLVDTPVDDVRINGQSIVESGVANIPYGSNDNYGLLKASSTNGIFASGGVLSINNASESDIKGGTEELKPLTPNREHMATFYGLAKASGDSTQSQSDNKVGVYTDEAKASIKNMLGVEDVDIDSKAPVITETATGSIVSFDDGADDIPLKSCIVQVEPVQDLHGQSNPYPAGGGKNLLPCILESGNQNGFTWTVGSDGVIVISGSSSSGVVEKVIGSLTLESGTYRMNGGTYPTNDIRMQLKLASGGSSITMSYNNNDAAFTIKETASYTVSMVIAPTTISGTTTIKPMVRLSSVTDATYAPYSNECPITGWTGCEVYDTGINVWDEEWGQGNINGTTGENNSDNNKIRSKNYIPVKPNTEYYINVAGGTKGNFVYFEYDRNNSYLGTQRVVNNGLGTLTTTANACYIRFRLTDTYGATYNNDISINYPSTDTTYHPYTGQTYPITFPTEAGTVYGGYVDVTGGELVVDRAIVDLGTLTWNASTRETTYKIFSTNGIAQLIKDPVNNWTIPTNFICSQYKTITFNEAYEGNTNGVISFAKGNHSINLVDSDFADYSVTEVAAALSGVQLIYELATPITYQLIPREIKTLLGQNNIWADTGDAEVEYRADTKLYIQKKITEAVSALT